MWRLLELIVLAALVLLSITEFFYPLITGKPLFGSFRKKPQLTDESLGAKVDAAKAKVQDVKNVQTEVNRNYKSAEQLKKEADELLGKKPGAPGSQDFSSN